MINKLNPYKDLTEEERNQVADILVRESVMKTIVESTADMMQISRDTGVSSERLNGVRTDTIKRKFGI